MCVSYSQHHHIDELGNHSFICYKLLTLVGYPPIIGAISTRNKFGPGYNCARNLKGKRLTTKSDYFSSESDDWHCGVHVYRSLYDADYYCGTSEVIVEVKINPLDVIAFDDSILAALRIFISPQAWQVAGFQPKPVRERLV